MHGQDGVSLAVAQAEEVEFLRSSSTTLQGVGTRRKAPSPVQRGDSLMGPLLPWSQTGYMEQEEAGGSFPDVPRRDTGHPFQQKDHMETSNGSEYPTRPFTNLLMSS